MWLTVILGIISLNVTLIIIHHFGPKSIILTWVPLRNVVIVISMLHKKELVQWLRYAWASAIIPATFLAIFHFTLRYITHKGRLPRFSCAHKKWIICWFIAIFITGGMITLIYFTQNNYALFSIGIIGSCLNIINVLDAPIQLEHKPIKFTAYYIIFINAMAIGALIAIDRLIEAGEVEWAGISTNLPILAIALLAGSTCLSTSQAIRTTSQHVYMLAYQTWPGLAFIGIIWLSNFMNTYLMIGLASIGVLTVLLIQYIMIEPKL